MDVTQTIKCPGYWTVLVLRFLLEERGVRVHSPDKDVVALTMTVSGPAAAISAAAAELTGKFSRCRPILIEDEDPDVGADTDQFAAIGDPAGSGTARRCAAPTAKGSQCKLPAQPGGAMCSIHAS